jgi:hypothetical protein
MLRKLHRFGTLAVALGGGAAAGAAPVTIDFGVDPTVPVTHAWAFVGVLGDAPGPVGMPGTSRFAISPDFLPAVQNVFRAEFDLPAAPVDRMVAGIIGVSGSSIVVSLDSSRAVALFENPEAVPFETAFSWGVSEEQIHSILVGGGAQLPGGAVHETIATFFEGLVGADLLPAVQHGTLPAVQHPGLPIVPPNGALARFSAAQYVGDFTAVVPEPASLLLLAAGVFALRRR